MQLPHLWALTMCRRITSVERALVAGAEAETVAVEALEEEVTVVVGVPEVVEETVVDSNARRQYRSSE